MESLKFSFAEPRNGWLPVAMVVGETRIEFSASDVPNNPVEELIDALHAVLGDRQAQVWWHLEPGGYYFEFSPADAEVSLRVLFTADSHAGARDEVLRVRGSKDNVLLPFWRGLRQLQSSSATQAHWPEVGYATMDDLRERLRVIERERSGRRDGGIARS